MAIEIVDFSHWWFSIAMLVHQRVVFIRKNAKLAENWVLANRLEEIEAANRCMQMISAAKTGWFHQNTTI